MRSAELIIVALAVCWMALGDSDVCTKPECLLVGGDCSSKGSVCKPGLYENSTFDKDGYTCTCATPVTPTSKKGDSCNMTGPGTCDGALYCYEVVGANGTFKCHAPGYLGDSCADNLDCAAPRTCSGGVCVANLKIGDNCTYSDACPLGSRCTVGPGEDYMAQMKCYAPLAVNQGCTNNGMGPSCAKGLYCGKISAAGTYNCTKKRSIPVGGYASSGDLCATTYRNSSNLCDVMPFPTYLAKINTVCTKDSDCGDEDELTCRCSLTNSTAPRTCQLGERAALMGVGLAFDGIYDGISAKCENDDWEGYVAPPAGSCASRNVPANVDWKALTCLHYDIVSASQIDEEISPCSWDAVKALCGGSGSAVEVHLKVNALRGYSATDANWKKNFAGILATLSGIPLGRVSVKTTDLDANGKGTIVISISGSGYPSATTLADNLKAQVADPTSMLPAIFGDSVTGATVEVPSSASAFVPTMTAAVVMVVGMALNL